MKRLKVFVAVVALLCPALVLAEGEMDCNTDCSDGKVKVAYGDGNNVSCACMDQGSPMEATVPDPNVNEGDINNDD